MECDFVDIIRVLSNLDVNLSEIKDVVDAIIVLAKHTGDVSFGFCKRSCIFVAYCLVCATVWLFDPKFLLPRRKVVMVVEIMG